MSEINLYERFKSLEDFRRGQGRSHKLETVLLIVTMSIMSGYTGIRATGDFIKRNRKDLLDVLKPKNDKLPSFQTISRVLSGVDFIKLSELFMEWSKDYLEEDSWYSLDGKGISGTVKNAHSSLQEYSNLVSVFSTNKKQVLAVERVKSKSGEIIAVRDLIKKLDLEGVVFTLDALHCQKETLKQIKESGNDYVVGLKGNQKNLQKKVKKNLKMFIH